MKTTNKDCSKYVLLSTPFQASNLHAEIEGPIYVVYSYRWYPIVACVGDTWYVTKDRYSMSTARQVSMATRLLPQNRVKIVPQDELTAIVVRNSRINDKAI